MALTEDDVRRALSDPILQKMDFWIDSIHVRAEAYQKIEDLVYREQVLVVQGSSANRGEYDAGTDTITTRNTVADLAGRSHIIHESTHVIADMEFARVTSHTNEAAARIAQTVYILLSAPTSPIPPHYKQFLAGALEVVKKFKLDSAPGAGTRIKLDDLLPMIVKMQSEKAYQEDTVHLSGVNGISAKPSLRPARETVDPPTKDRFSAQDAYKVPSDSLFAFNSHDLGNGPQPALEMAAEYIKTFKGPGARVYITGHTDNIGNKGFNLTLSVQRAQAVAKWLVDHNSVKPGDVIAEGKGFSQPVAPNQKPNGSDDPIGRQKNRRVEILIMT